MRRTIWLLALLLAAAVAAGPPATAQTPSRQPDPTFTLALERYVVGVSEPTGIAHAGDGRLFVTGRRGLIYLVDETGQLQSNPFLDIRDRVGSAADWEQGLLGLAFHPHLSLSRLSGQS
jgi:hypothetical protein